MADYPGKIISGGLICGATSKSIAYCTTNSMLLTAISKSFAIVIVNFSLNNALGKSIGRLIYQQIKNVLSQNKAYFNNGFSQDNQNIYLSKSALGLPVGSGLSLEALFVALLLQWVLNTGLGSESKINCQWLAYGDKDNDMLYFTVQINFRKALTIVNDYEIQPIYTISPLDF